MLDIAFGAFEIGSGIVTPKVGLPASSDITTDETEESNEGFKASQL